MLRASTPTSPLLACKPIRRPSREDIRGYLQRLSPVRIATMPARFITLEDDLYLRAETIHASSPSHEMSDARARFSGPSGFPPARAGTEYAKAALGPDGAGVILCRATRDKRAVADAAYRWLYGTRRPSERVPQETKTPAGKCLDAREADGALSADGKAEIRRLIDYRNSVGHDIHELAADITSRRSVCRSWRYLPDKFARYDYEAVEGLQRFVEAVG